MQINVLGCGLMGKQIAALFAISGCDVNIWHYRAGTDIDVSKQVKVLGKAFSSDRTGKVSMLENLEDIRDCLTIETLVEDKNVKVEIFHRVRSRLSDGLYFSNTSSYSPSEIGDAVGGFHFYNPITLKMIELYQPCEANTDAVNKAVSLLSDFGFQIIHVKPNRGYIGNYILFSEIASVLKLIEKHAYSVTSVRSLYTKLYGERNIFTIIDLIGIDVVERILLNLHEVDDSIYIPSSLRKALDMGILGRKNRTSILSVLEP